MRRRSPPSPAARRALAAEYHVASHLFTLTQYLLGRIGESAVRSFARLASLFRDRLPSFSSARFDDGDVDDDGVAGRFDERHIHSSLGLRCELVMRLIFFLPVKTRRMRRSLRQLHPTLNVRHGSFYFGP